MRTRVSAAVVALALAGCQATTESQSDAAAGPGTPPPAEAGDADADPPARPGRPVAEIRETGNHLVGQPSPYLEQHAHNPVDWYPWGDEALAKAKAENKPIFLSIGYSTCHWCHVMEKESFEDDEVAEFLNAHFVSIKVDREQRPDVDALYIDAVSTMGGSTGWPLTVFLTPNLEPFFGGTYYPRESKHGRPGFMDVLAKVQQMYDRDGDAVARKGKEVLAQIERQALAAVQQPTKLKPELIEGAMQTLERARDPVNGGFGSRQKFPNSPLLLAELRHVQRTGNAASREHLVLTLDTMLAGGVRDHVGGSFHRYAVDPRWHIPHFEKTLYDNAQLAGLYVEAGRTLERPDYVAAGRAVLDDLIAQWQRPDGGFIVGFDADDPEGEGVYYSWTPAELDEALGAEDAKVFAAAYGVTEAGDREIEGRSVLHLQSKPDADVQAVIDRALPKLAEIRKERPAPGADDKELAAWNGLAIIALSDAARWLDEPKYREAAERAGDFIVQTCWKDGKLSRGVRGSDSLGDGFLEDHALAALGLLRLHAATGDIKWLLAARDIAARIRAAFYDEESKAFMQTPAKHGLPVRLADFDDGVLPSGGSAAVLLFLELGAIAGDTEMLEIGETVLERSAGSVSKRPFGVGALLLAVDHATSPVREVVVAGAPDDPATQSLWAEVAPTTFARILPVRIAAEGAGEATEHLPALTGKRALKGKPTAFVCQRGSCNAPTSDPKALRAQLAAVKDNSPTP